MVMDKFIAYSSNKWSLTLSVTVTPAFQTWYFQSMLKMLKEKAKVKVERLSNAEGFGTRVDKVLEFFLSNFNFKIQNLRPNQPCHNLFQHNQAFS
jgi:hypothetical protein